MNKNRFFYEFWYELVPTLLSFALILFIALADNYYWEYEGEAIITDVEYRAVLCDEPENSGKVIVTERLTYDINSSYYYPINELWRDLPEFIEDGVNVKYKVNSVKEIQAGGREKIYEESPRLYYYDSDYSTFKYDEYGHIVYEEHYEPVINDLGPGKWFHSPGPYDPKMENYYTIDNNHYECVFFYINNTYNDTLTFEIEYELYNASWLYNDCSELYLSMYSEDDVYYLNSFKGEILIPNKDMPSEGNYYAHTFGTKNSEFPFEESKTAHPGYTTFSFELDKEDLKFNSATEFIEFNLLSFGDDKHIFTDFAPRNEYSDEDIFEELKFEQSLYENTHKFYKFLKFAIFILSCALAYKILNKNKSIDKKTREENTIFSPLIEPEFFRDIPSDLDPNFAATLVFGESKSPINNKDGFSATLLSLVRKKYIELDRIDPYGKWTDNNVKLIIKHIPMPKLRFVEPFIDIPNLVDKFDVLEYKTDNFNNGEIRSEIFETIEGNEEYEKLSVTEELYFNYIYHYTTTNEISMKVLQSRISLDYNRAETFLKGIQNSTVNIGINENYFQKADYRAVEKKVKSSANKYIILGFLIPIIFTPLLYNTPIGLAYGAFIILGISFILSAFKIKRMAKNYQLYTQFGQDERAKWKGLYNFLNSETLMKEREIVELPLWEKYLVYATAFGISEKVIKALKIRCPDIEMQTTSMLNNSYYRSRSFYSFGRSISHTTHFSSHGGYSSYGSGSRGGGGGGGG